MHSSAGSLQLPAAPVTFCFTDIEGSTRLARRDPNEWVGLLRQHNQLLHSVWEAHGGLEVKTEGE